MLTYCAHCNGKVYHGGWIACHAWANDQLRENPDAVATILKIRAGEKLGRVVAELTSDGLRDIERGLVAPVRKLRRNNG